jgi:hypothetical protein
MTFASFALDIIKNAETTRIAGITALGNLLIELKNASCFMDINFFDIGGIAVTPASTDKRPAKKDSMVNTKPARIKITAINQGITFFITSPLKGLASKLIVVILNKTI